MSIPAIHVALIIYNVTFLRIYFGCIIWFILDSPEAFKWGFGPD